MESSVPYEVQYGRQVKLRRWTGRREETDAGLLSGKECDVCVIVISTR